MLDWNELEKTCLSCKKCDLSKTRKNVVIGKGNKESKLMFIGEGPGEQEDIQGIPFVGKAGKLLNMLLESLYFKDNDYYIANIVKCRPPGNKDPKEEEANMCLPYLRNQVYLIKPKIIVCLGRVSAQYIIDPNIRITKIRGKWIERKGYLIMPTFHPSYLLRFESQKYLAFRDFKKVKEKLDLINFKK
ncbi:MAG: uracil-DNA glycosylase [Clostridiales bacterium]